MNAAHTLLVSMGFQWFGDQKHIDAIMLDMQWRQKGFKWYIKNINTARNIFDLKTVQGRIEEESTRKQFLGFVNTVLSQGLGLKIKRQSNCVANIFGRSGGYTSPTKHLLLRPTTKGNLFLGRRGLKITLSLSSHRYVNNSSWQREHKNVEVNCKKILLAP